MTDATSKRAAAMSALFPKSRETLPPPSQDCDETDRLDATLDKAPSMTEVTSASTI